MATLFDHIKHISASQTPTYFDSLSDEDRSTFNVYMINKGLSLNVANAIALNEINKYSKYIPLDVIYTFYIHTIEKTKRYFKWPSKPKSDIAVDDAIPALVRQYKISEREARQYINIYLMHPTGNDRLLALIRDMGYNTT